MSRVRWSSLLPAVAVAFFALAEIGLAHKVGVFAFVDGDEIQVECRFSRSQHVKNGRLAIIDRETGDTIAEGTTDEQGIFRFRPSDAFLATGHSLTIRLLAGEGHRDEWSMGPEELRVLSQTAPRAPAGTPALAGVDTARLEAIVGRVVDDKLAPVKQALLRQQEGAPGLRDIIGGIGWILGLLGLAAYMKYRR